MIKAIFWDNDGVLVDTERLYFKANKVIFSKIGIDLSKEVFIEYFLRRSSGTWHLASAKGFSQDEISGLRKERNDLYGRLLQSEKIVIEGAEETLRQLYGKYKMGIVTSSRKDHFEIIHGRSDLLKYFDFILTGEDYENSKPAPDPYLKAVELSGFRKDECIVVEDSERGLRASLAAGLKCIVIPTGLTGQSDFTGAERILSGISEVPQSINAIMRAQF